MADERNDDAKGGMTRRTALLWLLGLGVPLNLAIVSAFMSRGQGQGRRPGDLSVIRAPEARSDSPVARGLHPRTFLTPASAASLREQIGSDAAFRARWQKAVTDFEARGSYWATKSSNALTISFAAILTCVRRPDDDLGLTWGSSWSAYRDRIVAAPDNWNHTGESGMLAMAHGIIYDLLYNDLSESERSKLHGWIIGLLDVNTKLKWQSQGGPLGRSDVG